MAGLIFQLDANVFQLSLRVFFAQIVKYLYLLIAKMIDLMYELVTKDYGFNDLIKNISDKIFLILIIFMVIRVSIGFLNYIIDPDSFSDKSKGGGNLIKKVIFSIALLVLINPLFDLLQNVQNDILSGNAGNIIDKIVYGDTLSNVTFEVGDDTYTVFPIHMTGSDYCNSDYGLLTNSNGDNLAMLIFRPFYQPNKDLTSDDLGTRFVPGGKYYGANGNGYCGYKITEGEEIPTSAFVTTSDLINVDIYKDRVDYEGDDVYVIDFNYIWALVFGVVVFLLLIGYSFDIVIRALTLMFYQLIAPIPIILYISPNQKDSNQLGTWFKNVISCWASLFIRFLILDIALYVINYAMNSSLLSMDENGFILQLIIIIGVLMFAKKLPQLLEEVFPGLKIPKFNLNPFKRVSEEALGGNALLGVGAATSALALSGATNFAHRAFESGFDENGNKIRFKNWRNNDGSVSFRSIAGGALRTTGSTIAGATRGGLNAFNRTRKDGNMFGGLWNGYQTAMFAKKQRDDDIRKAGLENAGIGERIKFGAESVIADLHRYTGTLNEGQREYLIQSQIELNIKEMDKQHELNKRDFQLYGQYMSFIDGKIKVDDNVKQAQALYDGAFNVEYDSEEEKIAAINKAKEKLDRAKREAFINLRENNDQVKATIKSIDDLRNNTTNIKLKDFKYDISKADGAFNSKAMYTAQDEVTVMDANHAEDVYQYKYANDTFTDSNGNVVKSVRGQYGHDYDYYQQEVTRPKIANDRRAVKEGEQAGYKPSPNRTGYVTDNSYMSTLRGGSGGESASGGNRPRPGGGHHRGGRP